MTAEEAIKEISVVLSRLEDAQDSMRVLGYLLRKQRVLVHRKPTPWELGVPWMPLNEPDLNVSDIVVKTEDGETFVIQLDRE